MNSSEQPNEHVLKAKERLLEDYNWSAECARAYVQGVLDNATLQDGHYGFDYRNNYKEYRLFWEEILMLLQ